MLLGHPTTVLDFLFDLVQRLPGLKSVPGMYEVLEHEAHLEIKNRTGSKVVYHKRQKVRFLQNHVIAYQDMAWGDGDIFADYSCSPGVAVDRYREGNRWHILISLRETKNRDDIAVFDIQRTILEGFTQATEAFQTDIAHRTKLLTLRVSFPKSRLPKRVILIEQNAKRTTELGREHQTVSADETHVYRWRTEHPRLFEAYIFRWEW